MGFLKRLLSGNETQATTPAASPLDPSELEAEERKHELEVLRAEQERLDELILRQLRYEKYAWQPPAQGGERRAEDNDAGSGG